MGVTRKRIRILLLGALNGALYSAVMAVVVWRLRAWALERNIAEAAAVGNNPVQMVANERWESIVIILIIIFALTPLLVHRVWSCTKQGVWFWVGTGLIAVAVWNVLMLLTVWIEGWSSVYARMTWSSPLFGQTSLGIVLVVNLAFGFAVSLAERPLTRGPTHSTSPDESPGSTHTRSTQT